MQLRQAPSGPALVGTSPGQAVVWNGSEWLPGSVGSASTLISSRADLVAVVAPNGAGEFVLPAGSYLFTALVALNAGESIVLQNAGTKLAGVTPASGFSSDGAGGPVLLSQASGVQLEGLTVQSTSADAACEVSGGDCVISRATFISAATGFRLSGGVLRAQQCTISGAGAAHGWEQSGGDVRLSQTNVTGGAQGISHTGGTLRAEQSWFSAGTGIAYNAPGGAVALFVADFSECTLDATSGISAASMADALCMLRFRNSRLFSGSGDAIPVSAGDSILLNGSDVDCGGNIGLHINGNIPWVRIINTHFTAGGAINSPIQNGAGVTGQAIFEGVTCDNTFGNFCTWNPFGTPANGMLFSSCLSLAGGNFLNGTALAAPANVKCCAHNGALEPELPIVP